MKSFLNCLFLLYCSSLVYSQQTSLENEGLKGKVKSVTSTKFTQEPAMEAQFYSKYYYSYNENGYLLEFSNYEKINGPKTIITLHKYDSLGHYIDDTSFYKNKERESKSTYKRDKFGNLIEWIEYSNVDSFLRKHIFNYNSKKQLIKHSIYNSSGLIKTYTNTWDSKGNLLKEIVTKAYGLLDYQYTYTYDNNGRKILTQYQNALKKDEYLLKMEYDIQGYLAVETKEALNGFIERKTTITYKFDKNQNWIDKSIYNIVYYNKSSFYEEYELEYREIEYY